MSQFKAWPKTPRLNRNCIATEKIDGTNSAVIVEHLGTGEKYDAGAHEFDVVHRPRPIAIVQAPDQRWFGVWGQSRKRLLWPGKQTDNFGFAAWVQEHALELAAGLGEGYHYGEWWGDKIQRGYGLEEKRFSLFNAGRWFDTHAPVPGLDDLNPAPECCYVVPVIATGTNINAVAEGALAELEDHGSFAASGFDNPEGIVVYHTAARQTFKVTCEGDESPKGIYKGMHSAGTVGKLPAAAEAEVTA